jgi:hypothetical protein
MSQIQLKNSQQSISAKELAEFEAGLNTIMPDAFRDLYLQGNGGKPRLNKFSKNGEEFFIHQFLSIKYGAKDTLIEDAFADFQLNERLPKGVLPFAIDEGGDYFLIRIAKDGFGNILFFQSDYYDDPSRSVIFLSESISEFLARLTTD